jgi:serine-type D-Ala-D-Ala carboxypeptidase (penicillin-binding protein 5/6)
MAARRGHGSAARPVAAAWAAGVILLAVPALSAPPAGAAATPAAAGKAASHGDSAQGGPQLASHGTVVDYPSHGVPRLPKVKASAFVVANAGTGQVLAAKDAHGWFRPASTLKVLTAISLIPALKPDATTVATKWAAHTEPNDVGLRPGHRYAIHNLFTAMLTISANDAAVALAQATGSFSHAMTLINDEAHKLQADDTVAKEPNGLDAKGQHTSAYDEALIARQALASQQFLGYDRTRAARFEVKPRKWVTLVNQNLLLTSYRGDIGGKLGWTSSAGATYMGMAKRHSVTLIVTLLHCPPLTEFKYAARLLNWGFTANSQVKPVGTLVSPLTSSAGSSQPKVSARKKPAPGPSLRQAAAGSSSSSAAPALVGAAFLLLALLIVAGFVVHHRRAMAARRRGRGNGPPARPRRLPAQPRDDRAAPAVTGCGPARTATRCAP